MVLEEKLDDYVPGKIIVRFKPEADEEVVKGIVSEYQGFELFTGVDEELRREASLDNIYKLIVPVGKEQEVIGDLYARGCVDYSERIPWRTTCQMDVSEAEFVDWGDN